MPLNGLTSFLQGLVWLLNGKMKCVNALKRANFISTEVALGTVKDRLYVSMPLNGLTSFLRCVKWAKKGTDKCVNALKRANFISTDIELESVDFK